MLCMTWSHSHITWVMFDLESHSHITWVMLCMTWSHSHITWVMFDLESHSHITSVMLCCTAVKHALHELRKCWCTVTHSLGHQILTQSIILNVMSFFACNDTYITCTWSSQSRSSHTDSHITCVMHSLLTRHSDTILGACHSWLTITHYPGRVILGL